MLNEFLKCSDEKRITIYMYTKFFNVILHTGVIPSDWTVGVIKPLYKNKGLLVQT